MRLAISGTHCSGKSSLVEAFLLAHPEFTHEPEAYFQLQELYGESFSAEPSSDDFLQQLEYHSERLQQYQPGSRVVFDRCAIDYVAYLQALIDLKRHAADVVILNRSIDLARNAFQLVDIVVFLPANRSHIYVPDEEDPELRAAVDTNLERFLLNDELDLFGDERPIVLEVCGTIEQRLEMIEMAIL